MEIKAHWQGYTFKADASKVANEIKSIAEQPTPQQIVDYAKDENTELHKCFTWDNDEAADKWRLQEARTVVCCCRIVEERNGGISVLEVLSALGGAKASKMYADLIRGYKAELGADDSEQD